MGKVYGLHTLQLRPGVKGDDFERFVANNIEQWPAIPGWRIALLKGDRGDQVGQYVALVELDSIEVRDRVSPTGGMEDTEEDASGSPRLDHLWSNGGSMSPRSQGWMRLIRTTTRSSGK